MDPSEVLLSDFELWHYVLNYQYVPASMKDSRRFDAILEAQGYRTPSDVPGQPVLPSRSAEELDAHLRFGLVWNRT